MSRRVLIYLMLLLVIASCGNGESMHYTIKGKAGEDSCKILIFGLDSRFERVDSIITNGHGKFTYVIETDTVIPLAMLMPDNSMVTLYAEPGVKAKISRDTIKQSGWTVTGGAAQLLHDSIFTQLEECRNDKERLDSIESFIKKHPVSDVNIEILRRCFIEKPAPDNSQIRSLISKLGGILQDHEYLVTANKSIEKKNSNTLHRLFPSFKYTTADSCKEVTLSVFNKKFLLVTFWAPWDERSIGEMGKLRQLKDSVKSKNFEILNIALEYDTAAWKKRVEEDSIIGNNVCETEAFCSEIANKFNIGALPYSILVNPYQRIVRFDIKLGEDGSLIDSLATKYDKEQEMREKEKKIKEKRKSSKRK